MSSVGTLVDSEADGLDRTPAEAHRASSEEAPARRRALDWLRVPLVAALVLLSAYAFLTLALNDPRGTLGTDTGGKLATLRAIEHNGVLDADVGYWAARNDPNGGLHPLYYTFKVDGKWVNATTLPMVYAAYPLYVLGGDRAILLLPMLGALLCAFAARAIAKRMGARTGWSAYWAIGLATPVAIYALDFWEHTLGLGLMLWGFVYLFDVANERTGWRGAVAGGLLFGAAATMRTEALVYLLVTAAAACALLLVRRRSIRRPLVYGFAAFAAAAVPLVLNQVLEYATVGASIRSGRATSTAEAVGTALSTRVDEAITTTLGLKDGAPLQMLLVGGIVVGLIVFGIRQLACEDASDLLGFAALLVSAIFVVLRFSGDLGFVSGMLVASPLAAVGGFLGWRRTTWFPLAVGLIALPVVWMFQYSGGAGPQWGGRYVLMTSTLLAIVAVVYLEGRRRAVVAAVALSAMVTAFGLAWLSQRSTTVAAGMEALLARHDQAVISLDAHALREGGAFYEPDRHWLTATSARDLQHAVTIVHDAGDTEFALLAYEGTPVPRAIQGYQRGDIQRIAFLRPDLQLRVVRYSRS